MTNLDKVRFACAIISLVLVMNMFMTKSGVMVFVDAIVGGLFFAAIFEVNKIK